MRTLVPCICSKNYSVRDLAEFLKFTACQPESVNMPPGQDDKDKLTL